MTQPSKRIHGLHGAREWSAYCEDEQRHLEVESQDTQPLPRILPLHPSLAQLRQYCDMSCYELATASHVRLCRVRWMELGIASSYREVMNVLHVLSQHTHYQFRIQDIRGLRVREFDEMLM